MPEIKLTHVTKRWGKFYAVDDLSLDMEDNSFITLLGPSGCGKTTTLRMIAGLETPTSGQIKIGDRVVFDSEAGINVPANKRKVGFLFQNYALWPNMTVYQNISFGLGNIKEELPVIDEEAKALKSMIKALENPGELVKLIEECRDKKGKLDLDMVYLKLIDNYTISIYTAKELYNYKLHEAADKESASKQKKQELTAKLDSILAGHKEKGEELNEKFEVVSGGKVVTRVRKYSKEEIDLAVRRVSRIVKIGMFMNRYPAELSGGQQQRVAIARTLAPEPQVLFMDEPLSNLDAKLRLEMRYELQRLHVETGSTFVYVTHDQMEAMTLATKICLINNGVLQQYEAPLTVYSRPNNLFVADFVGNPSINFIEARGVQNEVFKYHIARVNEDDYALQEAPVITNEDFVIGVRPEALQLHDGAGLDGVIYGAMPTGMESTIKLRIGDFLLTGVVFGNTAYKIGQEVKFEIGGEDILLFDRKSGKLITAGRLQV